MGIFGALNPFSYRRKCEAAWNALMAAYTFELLSSEQKQQVLDQCEAIESSVLHRPVNYLEIVAHLNNAQKYHLFSLAMMNLGIRPALGSEPWHKVRNPHVDLLDAKEVILYTKQQLEKEFLVDFSKLTKFKG